ncbi:MAG TPA: 6,7-dimethyl-8-ribityllumazine synthase [Gammaproteobacteria bacterium]|nr:6,7-dimethyl-8-ribityllumazine synthase [Gammaproteobacteria bacterium]
MLNSEIKLAIVVSTFNQEVTEGLLEGALSALMEAGISKNHVEVHKVPGAVEIPLTAKLLALRNKFHAIICLGAVIRGETTHYDYVCQQVSQGCQQVMMEFNIPVIFGVLTTENDEQAKARSSDDKSMNKGREAAHAAIHMANLVERLQV